MSGPGRTARSPDGSIPDHHDPGSTDLTVEYIRGDTLQSRSGEEIASVWTVRAGSSGGTDRLHAVPSESLTRQSPTPDAAATIWRSDGEPPSFTIEGAFWSDGHLEPGWYFLAGELSVLGEGKSVPSPAIHMTTRHEGGECGRACEALPAPDSNGRIHFLLLVKEKVVGMQFFPGVGRREFRVGPFFLSRVGRRRALFSMLALESSAGLVRHARFAMRALRYAGDIARRGLVAATDRAFQAYQSRFLPEARDSYTCWVDEFDTLTGPDHAAMRARGQAIAAEGGPLISLLLPTWNTPVDLLKRCMDSVISQAYPNWQLCIADDASTMVEVVDILRRYASAEPRIRLHVRAENGHISAASNSALALADGEFIGLLDHDDELRPHALLEVVEALLVNPSLDFIYSDEDKIDAKGNRFHPNFKPDWNPDLLRSQNYICHFSVVRRSLVESVGGFRTGFEGSQDHDLFLRCTERLTPDGIHHIPKILYHWRAVPGSTALQRGEKDYAASAGARAVADHARRIGLDADVDQLPHGHYRLCWRSSQSTPKVSIIIPTRDHVDLLRQCVDSVLDKTDWDDFEILIVDNGSTDPETLSYLSRMEGHELIRVLRYDVPFNYSRINNWAVTHALGSLLCLLNNDIEVLSPGWLRELAGFATQPGVGAVGAMLYYPDDTIQHAGVFLGLGGVANHGWMHQPKGYAGHGARALVAQSLSAVTAACLVVKRETYERVGGLDEQLAVAFNDIDFCLRIRACGLRNIWTPFAELYHHESASRGQDESDEKRRRFLGEVALMEERWGEVLKDDPSWNPNLSLDLHGDGYAFPPRGRARLVIPPQSS